MTGYEVGTVDKIRCTNGLFAETQMAGGDTPSLFGVINKIGLNIVVGGFTDDLDGVFVRANGTIGAKSIEYCGVKTVVNQFKLGIGNEAGTGDIVDNTRQ